MTAAADEPALMLVTALLAHDAGLVRQLLDEALDDPAHAVSLLAQVAVSAATWVAAEARDSSPAAAWQHYCTNWAARTTGSPA